jgi:lysophospholipase L1-like esterase
MALPATDDFTGTDATAIDGRTTATGSLTWASDTSAGSYWQINSNRAYLSGGDHWATVDAGVADVVLSAKVYSPASYTILLFRANSAMTQSLQVWAEAGTIKLYDQALSQIGSTYTGSVSDGDTISVEANGTSIIVKQNGVARITTTSSTHLTNTYVGFRGGGGGASFDDFAVDAYAVADPTARLTTPLHTGNVFTATSGSGGTGTPSYQWQRSTAPGSGYSNLSDGSGVSGATANVLTDGSATALAGGLLFYKCVISWSGSGGPFDTNVLGTRVGKRPAYCLVIGDSIEVGSGGVDSPRDEWLELVKATYGPRAALVYNASAGGLTTADWYDSAGAGATARLTADLAAGLAADCTVCEIRLGINDASVAVTSSVYSANLAGIAAAALTAGYERVIIHYPTGVAAAATMAVMITYPAVIDALDNGTTIFVGDVWGLDYFSAHPELTQDGVHLTAAGTTLLAAMTALGTATGLGDAPSGGGAGGGGPRINGGLVL